MKHSLSRSFKDRLLRVILFSSVTLTIFSCEKNETELISSEPKSPTRMAYTISNDVLKDPLFDAFDKALYELQMDNLNYRDEKIDKKQVTQLRQALKEKKITTMVNLTKEYEKAGYKNFEKRMKGLLYFNQVRCKLFLKYPELKSIPTKDFVTFFMSKRKYSIDPKTRMEILYKKKHK